MRKYAPFLGLGLGVLACIPFAFLAVAAAGAGHGTYLPARLLFPFTMFSTFLGGSITAPFVVIGLAQFPLYGLVSGIFYRLGHVRACFVGIALVHLLAVSLTFIIHGESFPNLVQQPNQSAAANRRPAGQSGGSDNLPATLAADGAFPAAVAELDR